MGLKKRDCRRQRGADPTRIRSAPLRFASSTIALPSARARDDLALDLDTVLAGDLGCLLASEAAACSSSSTSDASSGASSGTLITCSAVSFADCSSASLIAVASTSSPIGPSFIGTRMCAVQPSSCGSTRSATASSTLGGHRRPAAATDEHEDHAADQEPDRPRDACRRVGGERHDPDREGERRSEQGDERTGTPRMRTFRGARYGRARSGSRKRNLITASCAAVKREEDAEAVQAASERTGEPIETVTISMRTAIPATLESPPAR